MDRLGRYEILDVLGRGAMGTVFWARDPKIDRVVAIKTITSPNVSPSEESEYRRRFFCEAHAAGKLSHPGLVTIHDVGEEESTQTPFIVMEYIEGKTLEAFITDALQEPLSLKLDLVRQVAEALHYAHSQGIVHRDIKPANIIVTPQSRAKITDFGIAKLAGTQLTLNGESPGTPSYMSPEQVTGGPVDGRSDLFSLGIILYLMLTGEKPFTGENASAVTFQIAFKEAVPPSQLNRSLDARFDYVVTRALDKSPARRYQNGQELADDLEDLCHRSAPRSQSVATVEADPEKTVLKNPSDSIPLEALSEVRAHPSLADRVFGSVSQIHRKARTVLRVSWQAVAGFRLRKVLASFAVVAILLAVFTFRSTEPLEIHKWLEPHKILETRKISKLNIHCVHRFRAADLFIRVDERLVYEGKLAGTIKKRMVFIKKMQGRFTNTLAIKSGKHVIRVQVVSEQAGYNQAKEIQGEFPPDGKKTLEISFSESNNNLFLSLR